MRADFIKTLRFWLDHGADGFRVDVAHGLAKDLDRDDLDDYVVWCTNDQPEDGSHPVIDRDEVHDIYHEWRKVFNEYDPPAFAVAEAWVRPSRQHLYASPDDLGQIFNFEFAKKDWIRDDMHLAIEEGLESAERSGSTATWVMSNHDVVRHATRYALPQVPTGEYHRLQQIKVFLYDHNGNSQYGTVRGDQGKKNAQCLIEGRAYFFQYDFYHLYQGSNDQDKSNSLHKPDMERIQYCFLNDKCYDSSQYHNKCNGPGHSQSCGNFFRYTQKRTYSQELCQYNIIDKDGCDKN